MTTGSETTTAPSRQRPTAAVDLVTIEPVTRVGGAMGVRVARDDFQITDAWVSGNLYRGYEAVVMGRDARDVMPLVSRSCGWCGSAHMTTAAMALEMAWDRRPPPMAIALRNIAECTEAIWIHAAHLATRAGPDYCAPVVQRTTPTMWRKALGAVAPNTGLHGFETIADIMEAMTPATGRYWTETIPAGRRVMEMISLLYGKFPHPSTLTPAGVSSTLTWASFTDYFTRLYMSVDYVKQICSMWDDLIDFLYDADDRFVDLGVRPASFVHAGCWDDVRAGYSYSTLDENGASRLAKPGVMIDGALVTDRLSEVHAGLEEHVDASFYEQADLSTGGGAGGNGLSPQHPASKRNIPRPGVPSPIGKYSWCTAPRWRNSVVESTPLGRLWLNAMRDDFPPNDFIECTGNSIKILVPMNFQPEITVEWKIPERNNVLERLRAEVYGVAFAGLCAAISLLKAFELQRSGEWESAQELKVVKDARSGVGLFDTGRGLNAHWVSTKGGTVAHYQIVSPSTINASPRDGQGRPGPIEEALIGSPLIEEPQNGNFTGVDLLRIVHSFDPCMNCGIH